MAIFIKTLLVKIESGQRPKLDGKHHIYGVQCMKE